MNSKEVENKKQSSAFAQKRPKFHAFRRDEKIPKELTLLAKSEKEVTCVASVISEARECLRVKIQNLGGNAVLNFYIERYGLYFYEAKGIPALISEAGERAQTGSKEGFLENLYSEKLAVRPFDANSAEERLAMPYSVAGIGICATLTFVLWCVFLA